MASGPRVEFPQKGCQDQEIVHTYRGQSASQTCQLPIRCKTQLMDPNRPTAEKFVKRVRAAKESNNSGTV